MHIELRRSPNVADARVLSEGIVEFNRQAVPGLEEVASEIRFHVFVREAGTISGGLRAACFWNTLHIELLWLSEAVRGRGLGRAVMARAEDFATDCGLHNSWVETTSWQARPFYERCGYVCIAEVPDRPVGQCSFYLHKPL